MPDYDAYRKVLEGVYSQKNFNIVVAEIGSFIEGFESEEVKLALLNYGLLYSANSLQYV